MFIFISLSFAFLFFNQQLPHFNGRRLYSFKYVCFDWTWKWFTLWCTLLHIQKWWPNIIFCFSFLLQNWYSAHSNLFLFANRLYNYLRLSDILKQTGLSKEQFLARNKNIEITCLSNLQFESNLLISSKCKFKDELQNHSGTAVEMVKLDDQIRDILQIEIIRVR